MRAKVVVVGPAQCGKTRLCNLWADVAAGDASTAAAPRPTKGCRILEFTADAQQAASKTADMTIELWDVSGDLRYKPHWEAIVAGAHAAIVVVDAHKTPSEATLEPWFKTFVKGAGIKSAQCMVVALRNDPSESLADKVVIPGPLSKASLVVGDAVAEPDALRADLGKFVSAIREAAVKSRDREESKVLNR